MSAWSVPPPPGRGFPTFEVPPPPPLTPPPSVDVTQPIENLPPPVLPRMAKVRAQIRPDMLLFGKVAIPEMFTEPSAPFHREIADILLDPEARKVLIMAPRKHAKSSLVACVKVLHHIMYDKGPKVVVLASKTGPHAKRLLGTIKHVLDTGKAFRKIFGDWGEATSRQWAQDQIVLKDGTLVIALGTGQQIVGLKEGHQRPTLIIFDDPEDMENTKTDYMMRFNMKWLLKSLLPTLDTKRGRIVVIGTPQCEGCMILKMFKLPGWVRKQYQGIDDPSGVLDVKGRLVLWPEGCSYDFMMEEKADAEAVGELSVWYSEYMCTIVADEEQLFRPEYNRYYRGWIEPSKAGRAFVHITHRADTKEALMEDNGERSKLAKIEVIPVNIFMGVDPASSESARADHSVNFVIAVDKDWNIYCLPYFRKRVPPTEHAQAIVENYEYYYPLKTTPEATGYQEALRDILRKFSHLWSKNGKKLYIPGLEAKFLPKEKKTKRHKAALHIHFYQRHVWMTEDMEAFETELSMWRMDKTKMDDLMDGFYLALVKAHPASHEYTGSQKSSGSKVRRVQHEEDWQMS